MKKFIAIILAICISANLNIVLASSSNNYIVGDESINLGSAGGFLSSDSFELDLNDITWVSRYAVSDSYEVVDGNSLIVDQPAEELQTLTSTSGNGPGGGSRVIIGDADFSVILVNDEIIKPDLHKDLELDEPINEEDVQEEIEENDVSAMENLVIEDENLHYIEDFKEIADNMEGVIDQAVILDLLTSEQLVDEKCEKIYTSNCCNRALCFILLLSVLLNFYLLWKKKRKKSRKRK